MERKLDRYLERGTLTVARLKKELIEINKMASNKVRGEIPNSNTVMTVGAAEKTPKEEKEVEDRPRQVVCYYCNKPGHIKAECFKRQRDEQQTRWMGGGFQRNPGNVGSLFQNRGFRSDNQKWRQDYRPPWKNTQQNQESTPDRVRPAVETASKEKGSKQE